MKFVLAIAVVSTVACEPSEDEVKLTSIRLAQGDFRRVTWGGTQVERFYVVARRGDAGGDVVVWSADHPELCSLGPLPWYRGVVPLHSGTLAIGSPSPARVLYADEVDDDGVGNLRFASLECEPTETVTPPVRLGDLRSLYPPDFLSAGYAALTPEGELFRVDPWRMEQQLLAAGVERFASVEGALWLLEQRRAVLRDLEGRALVQVGNDVRSFLVLGPRKLVYVEHDEASASNHLFVWPAKEGSDESAELAKDVCAARPVGGAAAMLGYFSPCADRVLTVREIETGAEPRVIASGVVDWLSDRGVVFYTASDEADQQPEAPLWLWMASIDDAKRAPLRLQRLEGVGLDQIWRLSTSSFALVLRDDEDALQFKQFDLPNAFLPQGRITEIEGNLASLRLGPEEIVTVDRDGVLKVFNSGANVSRQGSLQRPSFEHPRVLVGSARFLFGSEDPALTFLSEPEDLNPAEDEADWIGKLELRFGSTGERLTIAEHVREFQEVWWPERGLLYTVAKGPDMGIHFAAVDIPCEQTTGSQWACGF